MKGANNNKMSRVEDEPDMIMTCDDTMILEMNKSLKKTVRDHALKIASNRIEPAIIEETLILDNTKKKRKAVDKEKTSGKKEKKQKTRQTKAKVVKISNIEEERLRTVPKRSKSDIFGCRHCGIMEIKQMSKADVTFYSKETRFLCGRVCMDCDIDITNTSLSKEVYYCDDGLKSFNAKKGNPEKEKLKCDFVTCQKCYQILMANYDVKYGRQGRRR